MGAVLAFCAGGCQTNFVGAAKFPGGIDGCETRCEKDGLKMGAFVYAGEYSTACVCEPADKKEADTKRSAQASGPAAVGVVLQARAANERQQHSSQMR